MSGRKAYEMFTEAFGGMYSHHREKTQFPESLIAWDDLTWMEQGAWRKVAGRIQKHADRSAAARRPRS